MGEKLVDPDEPGVEQEKKWTKNLPRICDQTSLNFEDLEQLIELKNTQIFLTFLRLSEALLDDYWY